MVKMNGILTRETEIKKDIRLRIDRPAVLRLGKNFSWLLAGKVRMTIELEQ